MTGRDEILLRELIKITINPTVKIQPDRQHNARQETAHLTVSVAVWRSCSPFSTIIMINRHKVSLF
jgi:hypothetical protein